MNSQVGFLIGHSGIWAVEAAVAKRLGDVPRVARALDRFSEAVGLAEEGACNSDELLVGRAG